MTSRKQLLPRFNPLELICRVVAAVGFLRVSIDRYATIHSEVGRAPPTIHCKITVAGARDNFSTFERLSPRLFSIRTPLHGTLNGTGVRDTPGTGLLFLKIPSYTLGRDW